MVYLWGSEGVKNGNGPISLSTFYYKLNCWINAIDMLQKFLFMGPLLDDPGIIQIPTPKPGGWRQTRGLPFQNVPYTDWEIWGLLVNP